MCYLVPHTLQYNIMTEFEKKSDPLFEVVADKTSFLPLWFSLIMIILTFAVGRTSGEYMLHLLIGTGNLHWDSTSSTSLKAVIEYSLPAVFTAIAFLTCINMFFKKKLYKEVVRIGSPQLLNTLSRRRFVHLAAELFRKEGYTVRYRASRRPGKADIILRKEGQQYHVVCEQAQTGEIEHDDIKVLVDSIRNNSSEGFYITTSTFSRNAVSLADSNDIRLIDGRRFIQRFHEQYSNPIHKERKLTVLRYVGKLVVILCLVFAAFSTFLLFTENGREVAAFWGERFSKVQNMIVAQSTAFFEKFSIDQLRDGQQSKGKEYRFSAEEVQKAMENILSDSQHQSSSDQKSVGDEQPISYLFEIELVSGGWLYSDNLEISDQVIRFTSKNGAEISLNREEILRIKKIRQSK